MRAPLSFAVFAAVLGGCSKAPPAPPPPAAADVVGKYFTALVAGDCDGIRAASGGSLHTKISANGCDTAFAEAKEHGLAYVGAANARPDGRDPHAELVDVTIQTDGKQKQVIARLEFENGAWKVAGL